MRIREIAQSRVRYRYRKICVLLNRVTVEVAAKFRNVRLAGEDRKDTKGNPILRSNDTVRLDLALLGHLFTVAIKDWGLGLVANPVMNIGRPSPTPSRNRRLAPDEETRLSKAVADHTHGVVPRPFRRCAISRRFSRQYAASEFTRARECIGGTVVLARWMISAPSSIARHCCHRFVGEWQAHHTSASTRDSG